MKKKIKNLTILDLHNFCYKNKCSVCPLCVKDNCLCIVDYLGALSFDENCKSLLNKRIKL